MQYNGSSAVMDTITFKTVLHFSIVGPSDFANVLRMGCISPSLVSYLFFQHFVFCFPTSFGDDGVRESDSDLTSVGYIGCWVDVEENISSLGSPSLVGPHASLLVIVIPSIRDFHSSICCNSYIEIALYQQ